MAAGLRFESGTNGSFVFDTGVLKGTLREGGKSRGLSSLIHEPTGTRLDASMGLFGHYRLFTKNRRYGAGAWDFPSEAVLQSDGSVKVTWAVSEAVPFKLGAVYRWASASALDLETTVTATTRLENFESFLACYFAPDFTNCLVYAKGGANSEWMRAVSADGTWQTFAREQGVWGLIRDGRWKLEPNPVDWVERPVYAAPLAIRRAPGAGVMTVVMAPPTDCFAVSTPHETEGHRSVYLSLFGRDIAPGTTATARARLVVLPSGEGAAARPFYEEFLAALRKR